MIQVIHKKYQKMLDFLTTHQISNNTLNLAHLKHFNLIKKDPFNSYKLIQKDNLRLIQRLKM